MKKSFAILSVLSLFFLITNYSSACPSWVTVLGRDGTDGGHLTVKADTCIVKGYTVYTKAQSCGIGYIADLEPGDVFIEWDEDPDHESLHHFSFTGGCVEDTPSYIQVAGSGITYWTVYSVTSSGTLTKTNDSSNEHDAIHLSLSPVTFTKVDDVNDGVCVNPGDLITYTIHYNYPDVPDPNIDDVNIIDYLPPEVNFNYASDSGDYDSNLHTVKWTIGTLSPGEFGSLVLIVDVNYPEPGGIITNYCELKNSDTYIGWANENTPVCCWRGTVIYVDANAPDCNSLYKGSSWQCPYKYLQDAMEDANSSYCCEEIWVAAARYKPDSNSANPDGTGERSATFRLINNIAIYGGFPPGGGMWEDRDPNMYETILSGDIGFIGNDDDNSYHVVTGSGTNKTALLEGFTITAGSANGSYPHDSGGGMYNYYYSDPTVINCIFSGNSADSGGGMYNGYYSDPIVINCIFSGNSADSGGGMYNYDHSDPLVSNCLFIGNSAGNNGGGICNYSYSSPRITNCTLNGNTASFGGGVYNYSFSNPTVTNCILWANGSQIYNGFNSYPTVIYSDIQAGWSSAGWDPNTDPNLEFNMNFEDNSVDPLETYAIKAPGTLTGTVEDYNTDVSWDPNVFWVEDSIRGTYADFGYMNDYLPHGGAPNDCNISINGNIIFELGSPSEKHTWAFWFNDTDYNESNIPQSTLGYSSFIRYKQQDTNPFYGNWWWEIRINAGKLEFCQGQGHLTMTTESSLEEMGVDPNEWHHAVVVIDREAQTGSKIFIDGLEVPVVISAYNGTVDSIIDFEEGSPIRFGSGQYEFDGMLDEVRLYSRPLAPSEVGILYQCPYTVPPGTGNINSLPRFVEDGGYRLRSISPCIDVGNNNSVLPDYADLNGDGNTTEPTPLDLDFSPRFMDGDDNGSNTVDMGAFEYLIPYVITATAGPNGDIDPSGNVSVGYYGGEVMFTAASNYCYVVDTWYLDDNSIQTGGTMYTLSDITADHTVYVTFSALPQYTITASAGPNGSVEPNGPTIVCYDDYIEFAATPNPGYMVDTWYLDGSSVQIGGLAYTLSNPAANHSVLVTFTNAVYVDVNSPNDPGTGAQNDPFRWLQDGIDRAEDGVEVWVTAGRYRPTTGTDRTVSFVMKEGVAVYGGFDGTETQRNQRNWVANQTILSGDIGTLGSNLDNSYHVATGANNSVLDGFTVTGGNAANGSPPYDVGGGMYSKDCNSAIANCIFSENAANHNVGGGVYNENCNLTITNCTFRGNSASLGGGVLNYKGNPIVVNCTFSGNSAQDSGGGIYNYETNSTVTNCILWDNIAIDDSQIYNDSSSFTITYNNVQGGWTGTGNIDADPCFVNSAANDYHLTLCSPCINGGDPGGDYAGQVDIDGDARVIYGRVDMGIDEVYPIGGDFEPDEDIDIADLATFADNWVNSCSEPDWCENSDINKSGLVDFADFACFAEHWLAGTTL